MLNWIRIKDRLPKDYETVMIFLNGAINLGRIGHTDCELGGCPTWLVDGDHLDCNEINVVSHWMPLPKHPEDK